MTEQTPSPSSEAPETVTDLIGQATKLQAEAARYAKLAEGASRRVTFYLEHGAAIGTAARYVAEKAGVVARGDKDQGGDASPPSGGQRAPRRKPSAPRDSHGARPVKIDVRPSALKATEWITVSEAARRGRVNTGTVCREAAAGKFRTNGQTGIFRRIDAESFQRWVDSRNPKRIASQREAYARGHARP